MTRIFGEVASLYDDVRPGYPDGVRQAIAGYRDAQAPGTVVELGAGTGKATELLLRLGGAVTAIEPDPRMATVLQAKFPQVEVVSTAFEEWAPPAGGVGLLACATAWHWMDPGARHRLAIDALAARGTLAIFYHKYAYQDAAQWAAVDDLLFSLDPGIAEREEHWVREDVQAAGVWEDVQERRWHTYPEFGKDRYLALMQTFAPFRRHAPEMRQRLLDGLGELLDRFGGSITFDLRTTLVLARKPG